MIFGDVLMSYNLNAMNGLEAKSYKQVDNGYAQILETKIRDESTSEGELKESLFKLGAIVGQEICVDNFLLDVTVKLQWKPHIMVSRLMKVRNMWL